MNIITIVGNVAGTPKFTPEVSINGKIRSAMCELSIYENSGQRTNKVKITGFGGMAGILAKGASTGKAMTVIGELNTYMGSIYMPAVQGQAPRPYLDAQGQEIKTPKFGINVNSIQWGQEGAKSITAEIQSYQNSQGRMGRPPEWQNPGHPDSNIWKEICLARNSTKFQEGMSHFGYAEVVIYNGMQVVPEGTKAAQRRSGNQYANNAGGQPQNNGGVNNGGGTVNYGGQNMGQTYNSGTAQHAGNPGAVNNGFQGNNTGGQAPNNGGQNNGYPPNNGQVNNGGFQGPANNNGGNFNGANNAHARGNAQGNTQGTVQM